MKQKQNHSHQTKVIMFLSLLLGLSLLLLLFTNWTKLSYGYHLIFWKFYPKQSPGYVEELIKEKLAATFEQSLTETEKEKMEKAQRSLTIYFKYETTPEQILEVVNHLSTLDAVSNIKRTTKQEAYDLFIKLNNDDPLFKESISPDILPESLDIECKTMKDKPNILNYLQSLPQKEEVRDNANPNIQEMLNTFSQ